ncbi:MAG: YqeG family HAD IIIA-type phosphatase [Armatimonadetes bacterium]|nr:YqeG family HAD IIIA-type phosphatase [Armatimonadota bacterium]
MNFLARWLKPDLYVQAVEDVSLDWLADRGVEGVLLDVDNTLTRWRSHDIPEARRAWVEAAKQRFSVCLISNTIFGRRLKALGAALDVPYVGRWGLGRKPSPAGVRAALKLAGVPAERACLIGDQVLTDILGGKLCGLLTVLVEPVDPASEFVVTRIARFIERPLRGAWRQELQGGGRDDEPDQ